MTRKDYILIAKTLKNHAIFIDHDEDIIPRTYSSLLIGQRNIGVMRAAEALAYAMAEDNPRFDSEHFLSVVRGEKELNSRPTRRR